MTPPSPLLVAVRASFVVVVVLVVQLGVAPHLAPFDIQADLLLLVAIAAGIAAGPARGAALGFAAGVAYDLVLQTPFGLSALTYCLIAYWVGSLQDSVLRAAGWIPLATATAASALGVILYGVLGTVVGEDLVHPSLLRIAAVVALLNTLPAPLVVRAVRWATGSSDRRRAVAVFR